MRRGRAAALALLLAGASGCCTCARSPGFARSPAPAGPAAPALAAPLRVLHLADFGDRTCQQAAVSRGVLAAHRRAPFDLVLSAGDNLYPCGPDPDLPGAAACDFAADGNTVPAGYRPPADPRFAVLEGPLAALESGGRPVAVYLALGNHDVASWTGCGNGWPAERLSRTRACLEVAHRSATWNMPGRHWVLDRGPARFIAVDSNLLRGDYGGFDLSGEVEFVRAAARGCESRACFVVAHHPAATAGGHRDEATPAYRTRLARVEEAAGGHIAAWLCGHDHDLQHLRAAAGYDVFVSGNGARGRAGERLESASEPGAEILFASTAWGHGVLEVSAEGWAYRFEDAGGAPLHCCSARPGGRCQPVACSP